jgi:hypothetical protein
VCSTRERKRGFVGRRTADTFARACPATGGDGCARHRGDGAEGDRRCGRPHSGGRKRRPGGGPARQAVCVAVRGKGGWRCCACGGGMAASPSLPRGSEPAASESPARGRLARAHHRDGRQPDDSGPQRTGPDLTLQLLRPPSRAVLPSRADAASAESPPLDRPAQVTGHALGLHTRSRRPVIAGGPCRHGAARTTELQPARVLKAPLLPPPPSSNAARVPPYVPSPLRVPAPRFPLPERRPSRNRRPAPGRSRVSLLGPPRRHPSGPPIRRRLFGNPHTTPPRHTAPHTHRPLL